MFVYRVAQYRGNVRITTDATKRNYKCRHRVIFFREIVVTGVSTSLSLSSFIFTLSLVCWIGMLYDMCVMLSVG